MNVTVTGTDANGNMLYEDLDVPHSTQKGKYDEYVDEDGKYSYDDAVDPTISYREYMDRDGNIHRVYLDSGVTSIFYPPAGTSTTPVSHGTGGTNSPYQQFPTPNSVPAPDPVVETYRRNTHDDSGQPRQLRKEQEEAWRLTYPVGAMVPIDKWNTLDEIEKRLDSYCDVTRARKFFRNEVEDTIALLVIHGLISKK